jgi:hypothetical protein
MTLLTLDEAANARSEEPARRDALERLGRAVAS